ncbi:MAG: VaFE repeat-containing surface-anchored protein [Bacillota bacterium]|nr:VaFE repeat-containing surface-anchored protein [Bacillota bacterium]
MRKKLVHYFKTFLLCTLLMTQNQAHIVFGQEENNFNLSVEGENGTVQISDGENTFQADNQNPIDIYIQPETTLEILVNTSSEIESITINEEAIEFEDKQEHYFTYIVKENNSLRVKFKDEVVDVQPEVVEDPILEKLTISSFTSHKEGAYTRNACLWKLSNGAYAFCGQPASAVPTNGLRGPSYVLTPDMCEDYEMTRKVLYYGYNGPKNVLTELSLGGQLCVTNDLLQKAVSGQGVSELVNDAALKALTIDIWWSVIAGLANPPKSYRTYMVDYSVNGKALCTTTNQKEYYQKLFFGEGGEQITGFLSFKKSSALTELVKDNASYSLDGCKYGIYSDAQCENLVDTLVVDENGSCETKELEYGLYFVKETQAGKGYLLDPEIYEIELKEAETITFEAKDIPKYASIDWFIQKVDRDTKSSNSQGDAKLNNAEFEVNFFAGDFEEGKNPTEMNILPSKTWVLKSDEQGYVRFDEKYKISGDTFFTDGNGKVVLPYGTLTIVETKAPEGYELSKDVFVEKIKDGSSSQLILEQVKIENEVMDGEFEINKVITDGQQSEIMEPEYGAKFLVVLKKYYDQCNQDIQQAFTYAKEHGTEKEYEEMVTNKDGIAKSNKLAYGKYVIEQVGLGENGAGTEMLEKPFYFEISSKEGKKLVFGTSYEGKNIAANEDGLVRYYINDIPFQFYLSIVKKDASNNETVSLNSSIFKIKMVDTEGNPIVNYEKPKLKTDEEGYISLKVGLLFYDQFATNAQNRIGVLEKLLDQTYTPSSGEEKGKVTLPVPLPEGNYILEEVSAPSGYNLGEPMPFTLNQESNKEFTIVYKNDRPTGKIVLEKQFDGQIQGEGSVTFELCANEDIYDPATGSILYHKGELVNGIQAISTEDGSVIKKEVKNGIYLLDANSQIVVEQLPMGVKSSSFVMKEKTTYSDFILSTDELIFSFSQKDTSKKEYVSKNTLINHKITIQTKAHEKNGDGQVLNPAENLEFVDTVSYAGLTIGEEYTLEGRLMDADSKTAIVDAQDQPIVVKQAFIPKQEVGTVDVVFSVDGNLLRGKRIVVFEKLYNKENEEIVSHEDFKDKNQTIEIKDITIHTMATSENGSHEIQEGRDTVILDQVYLNNLTVGKTYKLVGTLMDKKSGKPFKDSQGNLATSEKEFILKEGQECESISFTVNTEGMAGISVVVFEKLYEVDGNKELEIANHEDIEDENQEVSIINIKTMATSDQNTHTQLLKKEITIKDVVSYKGLKVGKEYTVQGVLMNQETKEPVLDAQGNRIVSKTTFVPENTNGDIEVIFVFSNVDLKEIKGVFFEELYRDNILVACHSDIQDEMQTIDFKDMKIKINKVDKNTKRTITNKEFEFSMYSDSDCKKRIAKANVDTTYGFAYFENIPEGISYIKESKAPKGYKLSNQIVKVERKDYQLFIDEKPVTLLEGFHALISYENEIDTPDTAVYSGTNLYVCCGIFSLAFLLYVRKSKKNRSK